ncbi:hypothetical protein ACRAWD_29965 [Caulobacter segnis]
MTRPLWLDFPEDPRAWDDGDAYLLGPDLLVAPALDPGVERVRAYLPAGATWRDLRDDKAYAGGAEHELSAPLSGLPPMLAKEGSGVFVDLAPAGFAATPPRPGVLFYPPQGPGRMSWSGFDERTPRRVIRRRRRVGSWRSRPTSRPWRSRPGGEARRRRPPTLCGLSCREAKRAASL